MRIACVRAPRGHKRAPVRVRSVLSAGAGVFGMGVPPPLVDAGLVAPPSSTSATCNTSVTDIYINSIYDRRIHPWPLWVYPVAVKAGCYSLVALLRCHDCGANVTQRVFEAVKSTSAHQLPWLPNRTVGHGENKNELCIAISMTIPDEWLAFYTRLWPELQRQNRTFSLVTVHSDASTPYELFACRMRNSSKLRSFLAHPLLQHWYTMNYDLLPSAGRRIRFTTHDSYERSCIEKIAWYPQHDSDIHPIHDADLVSKVSPLPIGLPPWECSDPMLSEWRAEVQKVKPQQSRVLKILVTFAQSIGCYGPCDRRKEALQELRSSSTFVLRRVPRARMYETMGNFSFVAAPASRGQDTFRFWEAIGLGAFAIVQAGPLQGLYEHLPCVIVSAWNNITSDKLREWRDMLVHRFGSLPHLDGRVRELLSDAYYAEKIRRAQPLFGVRGGSPRALVNHTCRMSDGGVLTESNRAKLGC